MPRGAYAVFVEGLEALEEFDQLPDRIKLSLVQSINKTLRTGRAEGARRIRDQVNLPAQYLGPNAGRLTIARTATRAKPEGAIRARARATSLARFVTNTPAKGQPIRVEVAPGKARYLKRAFLVKLPQGKAPVETRANLGLAVRLGPGETLRNKKTAVRLANNLYLLYGPSVDQVFLDSRGDGVAKDMEPGLRQNLEDEFFRLMEL